MNAPAQKCGLSAGLLWLAMGTLAFAGEAPLPPAGVVSDLLRRDLITGPGKEITLLTVDYPPGGASLPHRHDAQVLVYVLQGSVRMQVKGSAEVTLGVGETFYESPSDVHTVSANASATEPARLLVVMIKDKAEKPR